VPEGDTVWRTARHLHQALSGAVLRETDFRVPALATVDLAGLPVVETLARGKHLLTRIGTDATLHTHLKMEGSWHLYRSDTPWRRPAHEARVVLRTDDWTAVGFSLGVVELIARDAEDDVVGHLGPDLLGADWDEEEAVRRLLRAPDRAVGAALLDQRNLAGIGNMYKAELCFLAGVSPWAPVSSVPDLHRLVRRARLVLDANKTRARPVTTGNARHGEEMWVYRRAGRPCRRCGTPVEVAMQPSRHDEDLAVGRTRQERATYWCPTCQPLEAGRGDG
jgi:endonuclease-8